GSGASPDPGPSGDPFRLCPDGAEVDRRVLRDLAAGRDPGSLEPLVRAAANGRRSVGYDLQFAAPKSVSVLAAFAGPEDRARIL
ncbi:relaxase domain-containing protein, partial [Salmonella enterica subsp. enterica serovar Typhimurium]